MGLSSEKEATPVTGPETTARDVEVCVIGAGPHALTVVSHLLAADPWLRSRIAVVDPSGQWMDTWFRQFARLEIEVLRSPIVHHPDVDPSALSRYVAENGLPRSKLIYDPPLTGVFEAFCHDLIGWLNVGDFVTPARVTGLTPGDTAAGTATTVDTTAGPITARHVVWTGNTCHRIIPDALAPGLDTGLVVRAEDVDLPALGSLAGRRVMVVGGGLTAGHLVCGVVERGAHVTLVTQRPVEARDFDVDPGWLGPRFLDDFDRIHHRHQRLEAARRGRGGGTMPPWMIERVEAAVEAGRVDHLVGPIDTGLVCGDRGRVTVAGHDVEFDACWLATGTRPDLSADPALCGLVDDHLDGFPPLDENLRIVGTDVSVTGRLAMSELGPAAGNLWGGRMAARRIVRGITGVEITNAGVNR